MLRKDEESMQATVAFKDAAHATFYRRALERCGTADAYHKAFFYVMGLSRDTRHHIDQVFDFSEDAIRPNCLEEGWQTSGSARLTRLAFNLWNGWNSDGMATPYDLFDCEYAVYMLEAVRLRYPEYCRELPASLLDTPKER